MPKRKPNQCPLCGKHPVAWRPLMDAYIGKGDNRKLVHANDYAVCQRCWLDQHVERYGKGKLKDMPFDLDPVVAKEKGVPAYKEPK